MKTKEALRGLRIFDMGVNMKREVLCPGCFEETLKVSLKPNDEKITRFEAAELSREHYRFKKGISLLTCRCDHCNKPIRKGDASICRSIWIDGQTPFDWEDVYIEISS